MKNTVIMILGAVLLAGGLLRGSGASPAETLTAVKFKDSVDWGKVPVHRGFYKFKSAEKAFFRSEVQVAYDNAAIFVRLTAYEPEFFNRDQIPGYFDNNTSELFLIPDINVENHYFHTITDLKGNVLHSRLGNRNIPAGEYAVRIVQSNQDYYSVEWRIPFAVFGKMPVRGTVWKINVARTARNRSRKENSSLALLKRPTFHDTASFFGIEFPESVSSRLLAQQIARARQDYIRKLLGKSEGVFRELQKHEGDFPEYGMDVTWRKLAGDFHRASDAGTSDYEKKKILSDLYEHLLVFKYQFDMAQITMKGN